MTRENILVTIDRTDEPNETQMTVIKLAGNQMEFKAYSGFTAIDIYDVLMGKVKENINESE